MLKIISVLVVSLMLLAVACGGGDDDDSADVDNDEPAAEATEDSGDEDDDDGDDQGSEETDVPDESDDDDEAVSGDHACTYLTPEEVSAALGGDAIQGQERPGLTEGATACAWEPEELGSALYLEVLHEGGRDYYDVVNNPDFGAIGESQEVDGLGDEALFSEFLGTLDVVEGDTYFSLQPVIVLSEADELEIAQELAAIVLGRLE